MRVTNMANFEWIETGKIMGAQVYQDSALVVSSVLNQQYRDNLHSHDLKIIWVSWVLVSILWLYQLIRLLVRARQTGRFEFVRWLGWWIVDGLVFVALVVLQVYVNYRVLKIEYPQDVRIERLGETLVRVRWQTYDKTLGIMVWGYQGESIERVMVANEGNVETKEHDLLLEVEEGKEIKFYLVVGEEEYGQSENEPYVVNQESLIYPLEEIETND